MCFLPDKITIVISGIFKIYQRRRLLGAAEPRKGGLSGKPLMELSTQMLKLSREFLGEDIPIMASGGVMSSHDYKEKLESGANLVQIYTGFIYSGPSLIKKINRLIVQ